ncbi:MAG: serine/threonine-protein kinase [Ramlibacter sp.]
MADPQDDDKTVIPKPMGAWGKTAAVPREPDEPEEQNALPVGSRVAEFEVKSIIGVGGFGIVYLAHDHSLGRDVALKEYLPTSLAYRNGLNVAVKTDRQAGTFAAGLSSFINEARVLAQFDHPSLVKVYRFWNENGTAYMVMPYYEGPTLKQALANAPQPPTERWLKDLLLPLLSALQLLHSENYFHRDIAPDNVLLVKGKRPILLDFGAARRVIAGSNKALTVILKPGFAPVEQYFDDPEMTQGAWTDIYALAAVMHYAITGKAPLPSVGRLVKDTATPLAQSAVGRYSDGFLRAIDHALSVRPEKRPQTIGEFRELLGLQDAMADEEPRRTQEGTQQQTTRRMMAIGGVAAAAVLVVVAVFVFTKRDAAPTPAKDESVAYQSGKNAPTAPAPTAPPAPIVAPAPRAIVTPPAAQMERPPAPPAAEPSRPFNPADVLAQAYELRDPDHRVTVTLERTTVRVGKDKLRFRVQSDRAGYLYILMLGTDKRHISLLFPNALDQKNQTQGDQPINLPRPGWAMTAGGPPGTNEFIALVSERPRDFRPLGLTKVGPFAEMSVDRVAALLRASSGNTAPLAGSPVCASGGPCPAGYGAARFSIEEVN